MTSKQKFLKKREDYPVAAFTKSFVRLMFDQHGNLINNSEHSVGRYVCNLQSITLRKRQTVRLMGIPGFISLFPYSLKI